MGDRLRVNLTVLPFERGDGFYNMERDALLAARAAREGRALFLFYGWKGLWLSLGYSQRIFDLPLPAVTRPTGGGVLLHGWDLSFALALPPAFLRSHLLAYRLLSGVFASALKTLGVKPKVSKNRSRAYAADPFCWSRPTLGELTFSNKKLLAAASRRFEDGSILVHGSVLVAKNCTLAKKLLKEAAASFCQRTLALSEAGIKSSDLKREVVRELKKRFI